MLVSTSIRANMHPFPFSTASILIQFVLFFAITNYSFGQSVTEDEFGQLLDDLGVKLVAFDMDKTAAMIHSGGAIKRSDSSQIQAFVKSASKDFKRIVPFLRKKGIHVAIATMASDHSDRSRVSGVKCQSVRGTELVTKFLSETFPNEYDDITIVAESQDNKNHHMLRLIQKHKLKESEAILFDDNEKNVADCIEAGYQAKLVRGRGFSLSDIRNDALKIYNPVPALTLPGRFKKRRN